MFTAIQIKGMVSLHLWLLLGGVVSSALGAALVVGQNIALAHTMARLLRGDDDDTRKVPFVKLFTLSLVLCTLGFIAVVVGILLSFTT